MNGPQREKTIEVLVAVALTVAALAIFVVKMPASVSTQEVAKPVADKSVSEDSR